MFKCLFTIVSCIIIIFYDLIKSVYIFIQEEAASHCPLLTLSKLENSTACTAAPCTLE